MNYWLLDIKMKGLKITPNNLKMVLPLSIQETQVKDKFAGVGSKVTRETI